LAAGRSRCTFEKTDAGEIVGRPLRLTMLLRTRLGLRTGIGLRMRLLPPFSLA